MMAELEANAQSTSPIAQLARDEPAGLEIQDSRKRKREDIEFAERVQQLEMKRTERIQLCMKLYIDICPNKEIDDHTRLMFKDTIFNMVSNEKTITNGEDKPITLSTVAMELGMNMSTEDLQRAGIRLAKEYFKKYNTKPNKHEQKVGGAVRMVNSYTEKDKDIMVESLKAISALSALSD